MIDCEDVKFEHSFNWLKGAQSQEGKTHFVYHILKIENIFKLDLPKIIYCYSEWQTIYEKMIIEINNNRFMKGLKL